MNRWIIIGFSVLFLSGCARAIIPTTSNRPTPTPRESVSIPTTTATPVRPSPATPDLESTPRALAALELTEQGRIFINKKRPDAAIRTLERAMSLYSKDGKIYYYLAEAWLLKGNMGQATEFNRLARSYLQKDPMWAGQVERQRLEINKD